MINYLILSQYPLVFFLSYYRSVVFAVSNHSELIIIQQIIHSIGIKNLCIHRNHN